MHYESYIYVCTFKFEIRVTMFIFSDSSVNSLFDFNCHKCKKQYKYRSNLLAHLKYECGVQPMFKCNTCGRFFTQKQNLKRHNITVHNLLIY